MARWRLAGLVFLVFILAGSCIAIAGQSLSTDSPWARFFDERVEKVIPETGQLVVKEDGDGSEFTFNGAELEAEEVARFAKGYSFESGDLEIKYPTGAKSNYKFEKRKVKTQELYEKSGELVVGNDYYYVGPSVIILTRDPSGYKRKISLTVHGGIVMAKEISDFETGEVLERWELRENNLELVERQYYLGKTDAFFQASDWDQLLLSFYEPVGSSKKITADLAFDDNIAKLIYNAGSQKQVVEKEFDSLGRLVRLETEGEKALFAYNWQGLLSELTLISDSGEETLGYAYDVLGRVKPDQDDRSFKVSYEYYEGKLISITGNGKVYFDYPDKKTIVRTDSLGRRTTYTFDLEKLLLVAAYEDDTKIFVEYLEDGKRKKMEDLSGSTTYEYNEYGQLVKLVRKTDDEVVELVHNYTPCGWLESVKTPKGDVQIAAKENILVQAKQLQQESVCPWFN